MNSDTLQSNFMDQAHVESFRQLYELLPDVYFFAKNRAGLFVMANRLFIEKCKAREEHEVLGKTDYDFFPKDHADCYTKDDNDVLETGKPILNKVEPAPDRDNSINWVVTSKIPIRSPVGEIIGIAGIARDLNKAVLTISPYRDMTSVLEHINTHYHEDISIRILAEMAHLSVSQFERKFKKTFQLTPVRHIIQVRIKAAKQLLVSTSKKISTIAQDTGFYDHSHFTREFIRETGFTPRDYRTRS